MENSTLENDQCDQWANDTFRFLHNIGKFDHGVNKITGFGTFLSYFYRARNSLIYTPMTIHLLEDLVDDLLANYLKVDVSKKFQDFNATILDMGILFKNKDWDIEPIFHMSEKMNDICSGWNYDNGFLTDLLDDWHSPCSIGMSESGGNISKWEGFREKTGDCCNLISPITQHSLDLQKLLFYVRESLQPISYYASDVEVKERSDAIAKIPFQNILQHRYQYIDMVKQNNHARITLCSLAEDNKGWESVEDLEYYLGCPHFSRSITTKGIGTGLTFNAANFWRMYKENPWTKAFTETMHTKNVESLYYAENSGISYGMEIHLQEKWTSQGNGFYLNIHNPSSMPNLLDGTSYEIKPGTKTTFNVWPQVIETSRDLQSIPVEKRGCLFDDEVSSDLFKNYDQGGCVLECIAQKLHSALNCIPWNYAFYNQPTAKICVWPDTYFADKMVNKTLIRDCQKRCRYPECSRIIYTVSVSVEEDYGWYWRPRPSSIVGSWGRILYEWYDDWPRTAIVQVNLATNTVTSIKRHRRVSITDQIANIGT